MVFYLSAMSPDEPSLALLTGCLVQKDIIWIPFEKNKISLSCKVLDFMFLLRRLGVWKTNFLKIERNYWLKFFLLKYVPNLSILWKSNIPELLAHED